MPPTLNILLCFLIGASTVANEDPIEPARPARLMHDEDHDLNERLRLAIIHQNHQEVRRLIASGADPNWTDGIGYSALHNAAVFWGEPAAIAMIADAGADVAMRTPEGHTPLAIAVLRGHYRHDASGENSLLDVVETLISRGAKVRETDSNGADLVREALLLNHIRLARRLLDSGTDFPADALLIVLERSGAKANADALRLLMEHLAALDLQLRDDLGRTAVHLAAVSEDAIDTLRWLLTLNANLADMRDQSGMTAFAHAVLGGNIPGMTELAMAGARLDVATGDGATPLHLAAYEAREDVLQWLIGHGASLSACDRWGRRPLDIALISRRYVFGPPERKKRLVALLGGTDADMVHGGFRDHPLHAAVRRLDIDEIKRLLDSGTSPDVRNEHGETAMRIAVDDYNGPYPMVARERRAFARKLLPLLIRRGADASLLIPTTMRTYVEHAQIMGVGDVLTELIARHQKQKRGAGL